MSNHTRRVGVARGPGRVTKMETSLGVEAVIVGDGLLRGRAELPERSGDPTAAPPIALMASVVNWKRDLCR